MPPIVSMRQRLRRHDIVGKIKDKHPMHAQSQNISPWQRNIVNYCRTSVGLFVTFVVYSSTLFRDFTTGGPTVDLSVFSSCARPPSEKEAFDLPEHAPRCVYFRPVRHFSLDGLGSWRTGGSAQLTLDGLLSASDVNLAPWSMHLETDGSDARNPGKASAVGDTSSRLGRSKSPQLRNELANLPGLVSVSALMAPKVGSRTVEDLFRFVLSKPRERNIALDSKSGNGEVTSDVLTSLEEQSLRPRGGIIGHASPSFWDSVVYRQKETQKIAKKKTSDIVFALVRDPVDRFLSSIVQILSGPMRRRCHQCREALDPCIAKAANNSDFATLLGCTIDILSSGSGSPSYGFFDRHVLPQATFLYGLLAGRDVEVAVFDMDRGGLDHVVEAFGANGTEMRRNSRENKILDPELVQWFGKDVFLNPKIARIALDEEMIRDICRVYSIDVEMMRYLGFPSASCADVENEETLYS